MPQVAMESEDRPNNHREKFLEWHIFEPKVGFVSVLKPVVKEVFTRISKEQVTQIAVNTGNDEVQNTVYFIKGKIDLRKD